MYTFNAKANSVDPDHQAPCLDLSDQDLQYLQYSLCIKVHQP